MINLERGLLNLEIYFQFIHWFGLSGNLIGECLQSSISCLNELVWLVRFIMVDLATLRLLNSDGGLHLIIEFFLSLEGLLQFIWWVIILIRAMSGVFWAFSLIVNYLVRPTRLFVEAHGEHIFWPFHFLIPCRSIITQNTMIIIYHVTCWFIAAFNWFVLLGLKFAWRKLRI